MENLRDLIEHAVVCTDDLQRTALIDRGLLSHGADFVKSVAEERRRDNDRYGPVYSLMFDRCRSWLSGDRLGEGADEDARRARFALWFCALSPGLARLAAKAVLKLPKGHPDRDTAKVRDLLLRQLQSGVSGRINVMSALDAIAGLLQLNLVSDERSLELIAAGRRIIERKDLQTRNENFRTVAALTLHQMATRAREEQKEDEAEWLLGQAQDILASLGEVEVPARDEMLARALLARDGHGAAREDLLRTLLEGQEKRDEIGLYALRLDAGDRYRRGEYRRVLEAVTPVLPLFEERYLTAIHTSDVSAAGRDLSDMLLVAAFSHAQLGQWSEALSLVDRGRSLRMRYERALRESPGAARVLELQSALMALDRGLRPEVVLADIQANQDPVGAALSLQSRLAEAYRQHRRALGPDQMEGTDLARVAASLGDDRAALLLADGGAYGMLAALVTGPHLDAPLLAASVVPHQVRQSIVAAATDARNGWLVALATPGLVENPSESLERLISRLDDSLGRPVAVLLRQHRLRRLVVVAHSFLHLVPFWALPSFADLEVTMVPSAHGLAAQVAAPGHLQGRALVVGNPTLDLPTAEVESRCVAEALSGAGFEVRLLRRHEATETAMNDGIADISVLHFAGHGRSDITRPLESSLEVHPDPGAAGGGLLPTLAAGAHFSELEDNECFADIPGRGRLYQRFFPVTRRTEFRLEHGTRGTLLEQYALSADPENDDSTLLRRSELWSAGDLIAGPRLDGCGLVFLSSCEVGQSGLSTGADEHAGLPAALALAGARAIISPLWRVGDVTSAIFAQVFYESLLRTEGEVDLPALVSRARVAMREMPAAQAARRVRTMAAKAEGAARRFALEAEAVRLEREEAPPFGGPLNWAAFHVIGAERIVIGGGAAGERRTDSPSVDAPQVAAEAPPPVAIPLLSDTTLEAPEPAVAENGAPNLTDLFAALAQGTDDSTLVAEAVRRLHARIARRLKRRDHNAAKTDRDLLTVLGSDRAEAHDASGAIALADGDVAGALQALDRAIELDPDLVSARRNRATAWIALLNARRAVEDCNAALERRRDDPELLILRGMALLASGNPLGALADFDSAIRLGPERQEAYIGKATAHLALQQAEEANEILGAGIARCPEAGALYLQRATAAAGLGEIEQCLADCDAAILLLPDRAAGHTQKGYYLAACGEVERALEEYDRALEANPGYAQAYLSRACALSMNETAGTLLEDLRRAIAAQPQFRMMAVMSPELEWARIHVDGVCDLLEDSAAGRPPPPED